MPATIIVGCQFGDEGKGKLVDYFASKAQMVVRFAGGNNAGHTVVKNGKEYKFHLIPSGILYSDVKCILGSGVVINGDDMIKELENLEKEGISTENIIISAQAHLILPTHVKLDNKSEEKRGKNKIGTTGRGIGPTYKDKVGRCGVRLGDGALPEKELKEVIIAHLMEHEDLLSCFRQDLFNEKVDNLTAYVKNIWEKLVPYISNDVSIDINKALNENDNVIFEGAQGLLISPEFGTYPYVTSSNPCAGGACVGSGVGPTKIDSVIGVAKAYTTRVGEGPFPTELFDEDGEKLRKVGNEFGTTTGRPRRCGWLDLVALKYAVRVNGLSKLAITKLDVLNGFERIKVCTEYNVGGLIVSEMPTNSRILKNAKPIYKTFKGWGATSVKGVTSMNNLPIQAREYLYFIENFVGVPIKYIGVGQDRKNLISRG